MNEEEIVYPSWRREAMAILVFLILAAAIAMMATVEVRAPRPIPSTPFVKF